MWFDMTDFIANPYTFTEAENGLIIENFNVHSDWKKSIFKYVKKNIIAHLRNEQENVCCYCKANLGNDIRSVEIEHIIPKSREKRFTFHPKNLALSCPACNTKKSTKNVLLKPVRNYPRSSAPFRIIHAHYDKYSQHINILENCVYVPLTPKGSETITFCELFRLRLAEENSKKNTATSQIAQLTQSILVAPNEEIVDLIEAIKSKIRPG